MSRVEYTIIGKSIVAVRNLTAKELEDNCWEGQSVNAIVLNDGSIIFSSCDEEGNGPGCLFGTRKGGQGFYV